MRRNTGSYRAIAVSALTALTVLFTSSSAMADVITFNDIVTGSNITKDAGSSGTASLTIQQSETEPSGDAGGCNARNSNPATLTLTSSNVNDVAFAGATPGTYVASRSVQTQGCGNISSIPYEVRSGATPGAVVTMTASGSGGKKDSAYTSPSFTITIRNPDSTPPTITPNVVGTLGNSPWYVSNVTVTWTVSDAQSAISSSSGCGTTTISSDTTGTTVTCSATSAGGTASGSVTIKRDATAPSVVLRPAGDSCTVPGTAGWCRGTQYAGFTASDATSGVAPGALASLDFTQSTATEGSSVSIPSGAVSDVAGNTNSGINAGPYKIDATAPVVTGTPDRAPNINGWYKDPVLVTWSGGAGATCDPATNHATNGSAITLTGSCSDEAGNTAQGSLVVNYDATAPVITYVDRTPANGNGWNKTDVTVNWSCTDALSGATSPTTNVVKSAEAANQSAVGTCSDLAGNSASDTQTGISIDKTAPGITLDSRLPTANTNGWNNTNVTVTWVCTDGLSGVVAAEVSDTKSAEEAGQTAAGTCADRAGNTAGTTLGGISIDKTKPTITFNSRTPGANTNGWNNTDVLVKWDCADLLSGVALTQVSDLLTAEAAGQTANGTCNDLAGNAESDSVTGINIDKTAPGIALDSRTPAANTGGWNNSAVTVAWNCTDGLSGPVAGQVSDTKSGEGAAQVASGTCADLAGNTAGATRGSINIDLTEPTITFNSRTPEANTNGWNNSNVTVTWDCADLLSGPSSSTTIVVKSTEGANQSATGTCSDLAGNSKSDTQTGISIDKTAPESPLVTVAPAPNAAGWNKEAVVVSFASQGDDLSGVDFCSSDVALSDATAGSLVQGTCTDEAGNVSDPASTTVKIDLDNPNAPTLAADRTPEDTTGGWYKDTATVSFASNGDAGTVQSGVDASSLPASQTFTTSGSHTASGAVDDVAGRTSSAGSLTVKVDATNPVVTPSCPTSVVLNATASAGWTASDAHSGLASAASGSIPLVTSSVGTRTVTVPAATATDNVGHTSAAASCTYNVAFAYSGFLQPINDTSHQVGVNESKFKLGSTVPAKFYLTDANSVRQQQSTAPTFSQRRLGAACDTTTSLEGAVTESPTAGNTFRYDATALQYIYNFSTKGLTAGEYRIYAWLEDGRTYTTDICLSK